MWMRNFLGLPWTSKPAGGENAGRELEDPAPALRGVNHNIYSQSTWTTSGNQPIANTNYRQSHHGLIDYFKNKGMSVIRLMFTWEWLQDTLSATIPDSGNAARLAYWNAFVDTVNYATSQGLYVIIEHYGYATNFWTGGGGDTVPAWKGVGSGNSLSYTNQIGGGTVTNAHFANLYSQLATFFLSNKRVFFGMTNEPHHISTMQWFATAQAVITAIRATGSKAWIFGPGGGFSTWQWTTSSYDTAGTQRSNAYGWENANGVGSPLSDPLNRLVATPHIYVDDAGGSTYNINAVGAGAQADAIVDRLKVVVDWARSFNAAHPTNQIHVFLGEIGYRAGATNAGLGGNYSAATATSTWANFDTYLDANADILMGFTWWAASDVGWWTDVGLTHFSVSPTTSGTPHTGDTINMDLIEGSFAP